MDLIVLVLVVAVIGFLVWFITAKVPMPPYWATAIQIIALIVVILWVLRFFGASVPNITR